MISILNRSFSKIWLISILAVVLAGGFFTWQKFGAQREEVKIPEGTAKESKLLSFEIIPSCKDKYSNTIYPKGAKAIAKGEDLSKVEFWLAPSGTGIEDILYKESETIRKDNQWESLLSREGMWVVDFYAIGHDLAGKQVGKITLGFISESGYPENCVK